MFTRIRQHHAIEHATAAILMQHRGRPVSVVAFSDFDGFTLFGDFDREEIERAVDEGITRLRAGESWLAITNQCGTNVGITGVLTAGAALAAAGGRRRNISDAITAATLAVIVAMPVGRWFQSRFTVEPRIGLLDVRSVSGREVGGTRVWRVRLSPDGDVQPAAG